MLLVGEIVTAITILITLFKAIRSTYRWGRKVLSSKWKNELIKYDEYVDLVQQEVTPYKNSKCDDTKITGPLNLLEGELEKGRSIVDGWREKFCLYKRVQSDDFIKKLERSRTKIDQYLQLFRGAVHNCRSEEGDPARPQTQVKGKKTNHSLRRTVKRRNGRMPRKNKVEEQEKEKEKEKVKRRNGRMPQKEKVEEQEKEKEKVEQQEKEKEKEKEKEENEYKAWLKNNITEWMDGWPGDKTVWERAPNSKLDLAERKRLFENYVDGLRKKYLGAYWQLLNEVITPDLAIEYLTSWSDAESLLRHHRRFSLLPKEEREREWRTHVDNILKKRKKGKKGHKTK